ncbi:MAG: 3-dehydroquinate synthase [Pyrinomonadaceae bacterium]
MKTKEIAIDLESGHAYSVRIGNGLLSTLGTDARKWLGDNVEKLVVVSNPKVFKLYGDRTQQSLRSDGFAVSHFVIGDGESHKDLKTAAAALDNFSDSGIRRTDAIIALGGGVVGDLAGFAAAIHLRGIPYLQVPTTFLAMIDSSVGGKTGVNSRAGKNMIGAFHPPSGVVIDTSTLATLPGRELKAGFCEAIKQGSMSGCALLKQTAEFLNNHPLNRRVGITGGPNLNEKLSDLIAAQVAFKLKIVAGDELESSQRTDARSRKILNFGHTLAHALEKVTDYKYFKHGEAVGYGIVFAAELSKSLALCNEKDVKLLNDVVHSVGKLPPLKNIDPEKVLKAFRSDKKNLSGSLQMILLKGIGKPVILTENEIPRSAILSVLKRLFQEWA